MEKNYKVKTKRFKAKKIYKKFTEEINKIDKYNTKPCFLKPKT